MRNYNDPQYKAWRYKVKARDNYCCRMPNCSATRKLNAHHIKRWADFPNLRYDVTNGITLCKTCHKIVTGNEQFYESLFIDIVNNTEPKKDSYIKVLRLIRDAKRK